MPYIDPPARPPLDGPLGELVEKIGTKAELTYALYYLARRYAERNGVKTWNRYADAVTALECSKLEMYRTQIGPYENGKRVLNGDVGARAVGPRPLHESGLEAGSQEDTTTGGW